MWLYLVCAFATAINQLFNPNMLLLGIATGVFNPILWNWNKVHGFSNVNIIYEEKK